MARAEILVALREPQRKLITLLKNRTVDLKADADLDAYVEVAGTTQWGTW
jgi:hypothetical protein